MSEKKEFDNRPWIAGTGVLILTIVVLLFIRDHFFKLIDYATVDYTGYYAVNSDEYYAVLEINDNEVSYFTTGNADWLLGHYAEGKLEREEECGRIYLKDSEGEEAAPVITVTFSGDGKKLYLTIGDWISKDNAFKTISKQKYVSLFKKISDKLYEEYFGE